MLQLKNITKIYPGTVALSNVNLEVAKGKVQGIIGKNGAGKTTLVGIISGIIAPTDGEIILGNRSYKSLTRQRARKEGVSIVTQEADVIPEWTVAENLFVPDFVCWWDKQTIKWKDMYFKAQQILNKHNVLVNVHERVKDLTISEQQLLLIMKACYVEDAEIIILDEVSTSLSKNDEKNLYRIVEEQKNMGKAILYISHRMDEVLKICDSVTVIRDGKVVATELCSNLDIEKLSAFIVGDKDLVEGRPSSSPQECVKKGHIFSVNNLTRHGVFRNITFTLDKGEVVGFAGLRGSGRTEIFKAIAGLEPADEGDIAIRSRKRSLFKRPDQAMKEGIVYLPEDRDKEGLVEILSVKDNLTLSALRLLSRMGLVRSKKEKELAGNLIEKMSVLTPSYNEIVKNLSGGNRQKVMLGKVIAINPIVYLLDEPTKGIDISAKREIMDFIKEQLVIDSGVILTLSEIQGLIDICDRIYVLYKGEVVANFSKNEFDEADIYNATQGLYVQSQFDRHSKFQRLGD